jgi:PQQ-like domain
MRARRPAQALAASVCALGAAALLAACGSSGAARPSTASSGRSAPAATRGAVQPSARAAGGRLLDWPEFGLDPQRSDVSELSTGITPANIAHLRRITVDLPGTVDSSPIYLHGVGVAGKSRNVAVVTTTYGRTIALDADSARILWTFTPSGYAGWAGGAQITNTSPLADPDRRFVYAASPDGLVHKLSLASGSEQPGWPARLTYDPHHEKMAAALNIDGRDVIAATGGYLGDAPPYQGHVVAIDRGSGHVHAVYNTLCSGRRALIAPSSCSASDSAILSRGGAVIEPGGRRMLIATGNGPWNGTSDFGDSVIELGFPDLQRRQSFTPTDQRQLSESDSDLGSSAPALLGHGRVAIAGKDGVLRVLALSRLDGRAPSRRGRLGGELQRLQVPGGAELFTAPAVWMHGGHTTMFIADGAGTAALVLRGGRLYRVWANARAGTSPVMAGGLLYVYDPTAGGIYVYRPNSPSPLAKLPGRPGHWNSPIAVDGRVLEPEGDANDHTPSGTLDIFSAG